MNIIVLDDHALVRQGLTLLLDHEDDMAVIAQAASLKELPAAGTPVDVVVADLVLGEDTDTDVVASVREQFPDARVVVVTMLDDPDAAMRALDAGAAGYVSKHAAADELIDALRRVARGERYVDPAIGAEIATRRLQRSAADGALSPRETDVLRLIAAGYTNSEVARELGIGLRTVEAHRSSALRKLGLRTRADIVRYCWDAGLLGARH